MLVLFVAVFLVQLSLGIQRTAFNNFANDIIGVTPSQLGYINAVREIPGLLTVVLIGLVSSLSQSVVVGICGMLIGIGLVWHGVSSTFAQLVGATLVFSIGFHMFYPMQASLVLSLADKGSKGRRMGQFGGAQAAASLAAIVIVYTLAEWLSGVLYYRIIFWAAAALAVFGGGLMLVKGRAGSPAEVSVARYVFRRKYMSFYVLRLLSASQRHVFNTFAVYLMVREFGITVQTVAILMAVSNAFAIYVRPAIGRLVDSWGTRATLVLGYSVGTATAITYAFVPYLFILYVAYCFDALVAGMETAINVHLDNIAPDSDVAPSLAMGGTINHILGLVIPVVGGTLWAAVGYQATFLMGAAVTLICVLYSTTLPGRGKTDAPAAD